MKYFQLTGVVLYSCCEYYYTNKKKKRSCIDTKIVGLTKWSVVLRRNRVANANSVMLQCKLNFWAKTRESKTNSQSTRTKSKVIGPLGLSK